MWTFGIEQNYFADHFSPVLLALVPFDIVFRTPLALLVIEALVFGGGLWVVVGCARTFGLRPALSWLLGMAYAMNSIAWQSFGFDFHPEAMLPALCFAVLFSLKARRWGWLVLSLIAALSLKEDVALVLVPMVALVWLDQRREWRSPLMVSLASLVWMALALHLAMPAARPPGANWGMFAERYGEWGASPVEALGTMASHPLKVFQLLVDKPVLRLLTQLGWTPVLDPLGALAAAPAILEHRLANSEVQRDLQAYYGIGGITVWLLALLRSVR